MITDRILILDTETTGLDPKTDAVVEVAVAVFHLPSACVVRQSSFLVLPPTGEPSNSMQRVNRIPVEAIRACGMQSENAWEHVDKIASTCSAVLAHNAPFDLGFVPVSEDTYLVRNLPWIDTKEDVAWPLANKPGESLVNLTLAHGLGIGHAHRAMADVDMLCRLLTRCHEMGHDLQKMLANALRPKAVFQALVSYDDREKAKGAGFHWIPDAKAWTRRMFVEDAAKLPFKVNQIAK